MATHGSGFFSPFVIGSVCERLIRKTAIPTLIVPYQAPGSGHGAAIPFRRIVVMTDFSSASEDAYKVASSEATFTDAKVTVLHVLEKPYGPDIQDVMTDAVSGYLEELGERCEYRLSERLEREAQRFDGHSSDYVLLPAKHGNSVSREALEFLQKSPPDLLVLATRGAGHSFSLGGVAERLIRTAPCPMLIVPPLTHDKPPHGARKVQ
jgi:nucleotide-binding universal stress UspA family protein